MLHQFQEFQDVQILCKSMGKSFRLMAMSDNDDESNQYMARHDEAAVIAEFGGIIFLASKYEIREQPKKGA
jgi:hypothetical protein